MFLRGPRLFGAYLINNDYFSARISHARLYRVGSVNISTILFRFSSISSNSLRGQAVCCDLSVDFSPHKHLIWGNTLAEFKLCRIEPSLRQFVDSESIHLNFKCRAMLQVCYRRLILAGRKRWTNNRWRGFTFRRCREYCSTSGILNLRINNLSRYLDHL